MSDNNKTLTVGLVSLGCAKNLVDTQVMSGVLLTEGIMLAPNPDECDAVLINTCAFIESAREEASEEILRACELKKAGAIGSIVVAGCLPQRYGGKLVDEFPDVDAWIGVDQLEDIAEIVRQVALSGARRRRKAIVRVTTPCTEIFEPRIPALTITGGTFRLSQDFRGMQPCVRLLRHSGNPRPLAFTQGSRDPWRGFRASGQRHPRVEHCRPGRDGLWP